MKRLTYSAALFCLLALMLAGCGGGAATLNPDDLLTTDAVVENLREEGMILQAGVAPTEPFFTTSGLEYLVAGGGTLQIYEYRTEAAASLDVNRIDSERMAVTTSPHVYQRGNILAVYFGDNTGVQQRLASVLGPQVL